MTALMTNQRERTRFIRFMVVGAVGAVVDFTTFNLLNALLHVPAILAQAISFTLAVLSNFIWNRYWTYPDSRSKSISQQLVQFFVVNVIGLFIRTLIFTFIQAPLLYLFMRVLPPVPVFSAQFLTHNGALAIAIIVVMLWNFFVNRYWTYNDIQ
ncbi:MAG: GtrA family protein [Omnitrophica WOR_2 bacterium]